MKNPKVSIIIPVYNAEKYLKICLTSCANQTYQNLEIITIDDGSTDNSLSILQDFTKKHPITIKQQQNSGGSAARNAGLKLATGKYIYFLDADDCLFPNSIELLVTAAENSNADIVIGNYQTIDHNGNKLQDIICCNTNKTGTPPQNYLLYLPTHRPSFTA